MAAVELSSINKTFGSVETIPNLTLSIPHGSFTVLVGPSGCGKSTLLRMVAGLEQPTKGSIAIGNRDVTHEEPSKRGISMVFQSYALFPHMTVEQNIDFGLRLAKVPQAEREARVAAAAEVLHLKPLLQRKPAALSGGQRQRVAIGRSIVRNPEVFLFDEPLSNLDAALRTQMRVELADLHKRLNATMIYVTHDQVEAMTLADQIVVMNAGRIEQVGSPMELYDAPNTLFVATFIGSPRMNLISGESAKAEGAATIGVRPEHIAIDDANGIWTGRLRFAEHLGNETIAYVESDEGEIIIRLAGHHGLTDGTLRMTPDRLHLHRFDENGRRISAVN
ncbi:ATP-binding cassette domain-containing protein [Mesorhizobium sp. M8A.F.Ca.ET.208.01.1.1]|uniref:ABC transporter ATP-binding protein n=1 Tax=unclassified Mesorhizobium TaxID=325217 RepID=UPI00109407D4|nr:MULTISPECIES: ATP-binding cassette domain-containing protein [unclassified Mesorhizobium]TGQ89134.1 ATP-binding cassette domain-containing protein [Mesorhizobium sp. M8A.F.Ca.ET.208.01.1.1]TGR32238.1 ATP-binding cassette domain-containing protein [Mesorhizobium sp. M8A.F.Ca.ET.202.01.1.1]TGT50454.1 ATP-binding cassette domain-containing protein [Mesorhizobium sp. M8A.F.Ca.ET.167.01.1.1]TGU40117.1 ATP-binding cassette domain-containing protein [bacterium M00.F.Ca.ET.156.01.1.1]